MMGNSMRPRACDRMCNHTHLNTYQTPQFGWWRVVSVFEQTTSLHPRGISVVSMDTRATCTLRRGAQTPLHPHHPVIGTDAATQRGCRKERNTDRQNIRYKKQKNEFKVIPQVDTWSYFHYISNTQQSALFHKILTEQLLFNWHL